MTMVEPEAPISRSHNLPPEIDALPEQLKTLGGIAGDKPMESEAHVGLLLRVYKRIQGANAWAKEVPEITDEVTAKACKDFRAIIAAELEDIEATRKVEKKPLDDAVAKLQAFYNGVKSYLNACDDVLQPKLKGWLLREQKRIDAATAAAAAEARRKQEEAAELALTVATGTATIETIVAADTAQKEAEDATKLAARAGAQKPMVRGEIAARGTGLKKVWSAEIVDVRKALGHYRQDKTLLETLQKLADADAKRLKDSGQTVPGVVFKSRDEIAR